MAQELTTITVSLPALVREDQVRRAQQELERRLLAALDGGEATPMTAADWNDIKALVFGSLREEIQEGLDSGPAGPLDREGVRAEARKSLSKTK